MAVCCCATSPQFPQLHLEPTRRASILRPLRRRSPSLSFRCRSLLPPAASVGSSAADYPLSGRAADDPGGQPATARRPPRRSVAGVDQGELVDHKELADADSFFCEFNGVDLHHRICHCEEIDEKVGVKIPVVLLHGFGASAFSWDRIMRPLARMVKSKVLAFDRPAFGLTSRTTVSRALNPYSMTFSVLATLFFIDHIAASKTGDKEKKGSKAILMGHSAGCLVAVETYFEAPEKVAALILVAPAIIAPLAPRRIDKEKMRTQKENGPSKNPFMRFLKVVANISMQLMRVAFNMLKAMRDMVGSLYARALSAFLRSSLALMLVRMIMDKFGVLAIRNAWFDPSRITDYVIQGYTKPLRVKGWERALLEYTLALLTESSTKPPLSERLAQISCPVLIVTGDNDRLVPAWNAERLSRVIPGSSFEVIKHCGHLPHEEKVEEFLVIVERFLQRVFGVADSQFVPAAA
ncbi:abhydrolase domain-containing protein abhd-5.2-like isoform X2 [Zingiber officinale]|uniref:abhydrolase domain-containing protein abhd-5.2-like isoform X2 n=1 Tax=Zingiber officinale TaxID=94328 RepID=UPI001C4B3E43|nr:abhydrolase domain-containing protein abhd-5.2-like isoform X2 [Zingiber officinale]